MTEQDRSPDEQLYKSTKGQAEVKQIYKADAESDSQPATQLLQDKSVADTFPASDPPATSSSTTATPSQKKPADSNEEKGAEDGTPQAHV